MGNKKINNGAAVRAQQEREEAKLRIDQYNKNPHTCLNCGAAIYAPYDKKLHNTLIKKFCSRSCAAIYNNNLKKCTKIDQFTDEELIEIFNKSKNISDFYDKLGYSSNYLRGESFIKRIYSIGLDLNDISRKKYTT